MGKAEWHGTEEDPRLGPGDEDDMIHDGIDPHDDDDETPGGGNGGGGPPGGGNNGGGGPSGGGNGGNGGRGGNSGGGNGGANSVDGKGDAPGGGGGKGATPQMPSRGPSQRMPSGYAYTPSSPAYVTVKSLKAAVVIREGAGGDASVLQKKLNEAIHDPSLAAPAVIPTEPIPERLADTVGVSSAKAGPNFAPVEKSDRRAVEVKPLSERP